MVCKLNGSQRSLHSSRDTPCKTIRASKPQSSSLRALNFASLPANTAWRLFMCCCGKLPPFLLLGIFPAAEHFAMFLYLWRSGKDWTPECRRDWVLVQILFSVPLSTNLILTHQNAPQNGPKTNPECDQKIDHVINRFYRILPLRVGSKTAHAEPRCFQRALKELRQQEQAFLKTCVS